MCVLAKTFKAPSLVNLTQAFSQSAAVASLTSLLADFRGGQSVGEAFFLSLSLPFSSMVIERSFDGRICRWRAAIIHLQCRRELWLQSFFGKSVQPVAKLARYNKRRIESTNLWLKMLTFFEKHANALRNYDCSHSWLERESEREGMWGKRERRVREREHRHSKKQYPIAGSKLTRSTALWTQTANQEDFFSFLARPTSSWIIRSPKQKHETHSTVFENWTLCEFQGAWSNLKKKKSML